MFQSATGTPSITVLFTDQAVEQFVWPHGPDAEPSLAGGLTQNRQLLRVLSKSVRVACPDEFYVASKN